MLKLSYSFFGFGRRYVFTIVSGDRNKISDRLRWLLIWLILENRNIAILHCYSQCRSNVAGGLTLDEVPGFSDLYVYSNICCSVAMGFLCCDAKSFKKNTDDARSFFACWGEQTMLEIGLEVRCHPVDDLLFLSGEVRFVVSQWTTYSSFHEKWGSLPLSGRPTLLFWRSEVRCHPVDDLLFHSGEVMFLATQWTTYSSFREKWGWLPPSGRPSLPFRRSEVGCHPVDDLVFLSGEVRFVASQWTTYTSFREMWGTLSARHAILFSGG